MRPCHPTALPPLRLPCFTAAASPYPLALASRLQAAPSAASRASVASTSQSEATRTVPGAHTERRPPLSQPAPCRLKAACVTLGSSCRPTLRSTAQAARGCSAPTAASLACDWLNCRWSRPSGAHMMSRRACASATRLMLAVRARNNSSNPSPKPALMAKIAAP